MLIFMPYNFSIFRENVVILFCQIYLIIAIYFALETKDKSDSG